MDVINGITVLYALTAIVSFSFLAVNYSSLSLLITEGLSCLVFGLFNVRNKAKTFAGDVGSISMAFFLGYFMTKKIFIYLPKILSIVKWFLEIRNLFFCV